MNRDLLSLRSEIDEIDRRLVDLLAARFGVIERVAGLKFAAGIPARIQSRIGKVVQQNEAAGRSRGIPRRAAAHIWEVIVEESCKLEERLLEQLQRDNRL
jgi:chorismate mutase